MPKIAILSDIHANLPALEAVLQDAAESGADEILFAGDLVGYGAHPRECVELVRKMDARCVLGNHDDYTKTVFNCEESDLPKGWQENPVWAGVVHAVRELTKDSLEWLWKLPWALSLDGAILTHASLTAPKAWNEYLLDDESAEPSLAVLRESENSLGFFGHTHQQELFFDKTADEVPEWLDSDRIHVPEAAVGAIVVGSVGQPRNLNDLRPSWSLWNSESRIVEFRRTSYDAMEAVKAIIKAELPASSALRLLRQDQMNEFLQIYSIEE